MRLERQVVDVPCCTALVDMLACMVHIMYLEHVIHAGRHCNELAVSHSSKIHACSRTTVAGHQVADQLPWAWALL